MQVTVKGLVTEQIKAGIEPWEMTQVEVNLSVLTPEQRVILAEQPTIRVVEANEDSVRAWLQARVDEGRREQERNEAAQQERDRKAREVAAKATLLERPMVAYGITYRVWALPCLETWQVSPSVQAEVEAAKTRLQAEADQRNATSMADVQPRLDAAKAAYEADLERLKAEKEAANQAKYAKRLATGIVEVPLERGSRKEWGEPWIAKLVSNNGKRPEYDFSEGRYDTDTETLCIPCKPGEVLAYGQKNYRKPRHTIHEVRKLTVEGQLVQG